MSVEKQRQAALKVKNDDLKEILSTPAGVRLFKRLFADCGLFHSTFSPIQAVSAHAEGKRVVALKLLEEVRIAAPEKLQQLMISEPVKPEGSDSDEE